MMKGKMYLALPYNIDHSAGFYGQHSLLVNLVCLFHSGFEVQIHYYWSTVVSGLADESASLFFRLDLSAEYLVFVFSRSLKMREKYIRFTQLVLLSLYIF